MTCQAGLTAGGYKPKGAKSPANYMLKKSKNFNAFYQYVKIKPKTKDENGNYNFYKSE